MRQIQKHTQRDTENKLRSNSYIKVLPKEFPPLSKRSVNERLAIQIHQVKGVDTHSVSMRRSARRREGRRDGGKEGRRERTDVCTK